jgi:hypothetical protein
MITKTFKVEQVRRAVCSRCDYSRILRPDEPDPERCPACTGRAIAYATQTKIKQ